MLGLTDNVTSTEYKSTVNLDVKITMETHFSHNTNKKDISRVTWVTDLASDTEEFGNNKNKTSEQPSGPFVIDTNRNKTFRKMKTWGELEWEWRLIKGRRPVRAL